MFGSRKLPFGSWSKGEPKTLTVNEHVIVTVTDDSGAVTDHWELWPSRGHILTFHRIDK